VAFSTLLGNPNSALEYLDIGGNNNNGHVRVSFAYALTNNRRLMELYTGINRPDGYAAFPHILCNSYTKYCE
jgi:hypothetical protein